MKKILNIWNLCFLLAASSSIANSVYEWDHDGDSYEIELAEEDWVAENLTSLLAHSIAPMLKLASCALKNMAKRNAKKFIKVS